jgi:beta-glucanase (GH16 family)
MKRNFFIIAALFLIPIVASATEIDWAGIKWRIRTGAGKPCASGIWNEKGVWVDSNGWLHLKIIKLPSGEFACVEINSLKRLGFGEYAADVEGPIGAVDKNVVLGIFMYPPKDVGPDGTNEIDIEIARWDRPDAPQVNYAAWFRSHKGNRHTEVHVPDNLTHASFRMLWQHEQVRWESSLPDAKPIVFKDDIADQPQILSINLWLFKSLQPSNQQEIEFVIKSLRHP